MDKTRASRSVMHSEQQDVGDTAVVAMGSDREIATHGGSATPTESMRFQVISYYTKGNLGKISVALDGELRRTVALKEMLPEHVSKPSLCARFLREAEITGRLEHPGIVPVYGAGKFADGRPFYAMRLIQGENLESAVRRFHDERPKLSATQESLKLRELLTRFIGICNAIAFAHSRKVLHRDLKPANVMLGPYGEALIIDWGLAKATANHEQDHGDDAKSPEDLPGTVDAGATVSGAAFGTPQYMSPEQAGGELDRIGPATDVYGLGAILYELLTGRAPLAGLSLEDTLARAKRGEIDTPRSINARVPRPLEAVCTKALALSPENRYQSAGELANDIELWLADEPVSVYRDGPVARLNRWARRHKTLVVGVAGLLVTSVAALTVTTVVVNEQKRQAREARSEAERNFRLGLQVVEELVALGDKTLALVNPKEVSDTREQLLSRAIGFIRHFRERRTQDPEIQAQVGQAARRLANLYRLRGAFDQAEAFYTEAQELLDDLNRRYPANRDFGDLDAELLLDAGESWRMRGGTKEADGLFRRAHGITEKLAMESTVGSKYRRTWARSLYRLASAGLALGHDDALSLAQRAVEEFRLLADASLPSARREVLEGRILPLSDQIELVYAQTVLSECNRRKGDRSQAEREARKAVDRMDLLLTQFENMAIDDIAYFHADANLQLARVQIEPQTRGVSGEPLDRLNNAIGRLTEIVNRSPKIRHYRATLAGAYDLRARFHIQSGQVDLSKADAEAARKILQVLAAQYPQISEHRSDLADVLDMLGRIESARGDRKAAIQHLNEAIRLQEGAIHDAPENPVFRERLSRHHAALQRAR